ncbi:hypothetical protein FOYG_16898 [Fusarium oxysporum NRRL 32931]|uniref:Solute carrier family 40 member n=1 Tax=Fusarium oxysporum NRRL 32931 TaxID=660029 RepID=W9HIH3_FUSOX|nr:hypothetical protein FOYG_16898 [Fusarium oxysporum NRRL 32931]
MTLKSCPLYHAELLERAAIEAPTATETLAATAVPPTTANTSTAPLPATANGPAVVESPVAAVAQALQYNNPQAIYQRYTAAREAWYKAQPPVSIKANQQYRKAMGLLYADCVTYLQYLRNCYSDARSSLSKDHSSPTQTHTLSLSYVNLRPCSFIIIIGLSTLSNNGSQYVSAHDESSPLLPDSQQAQHPSNHRVPASIARRLYLSHFLSTWNSRVFEFGAVLYLATIFPGTLMPMSVYAFVRGLSAIIFAPTVGLYIDTGNRLQVVRVSIVFQRAVVATSCAIFYILLKCLPVDSPVGIGLLSAVTLFACIEKLCSIMNLVSVEKDWVVVVAEKDPEALRAINAQMRRIDLLCKLLGPLFIALVDGYSSEVAIITNFAMNCASVVIEYFAIARVYWEVPELQWPERDYQPSIHSDSSQDPDGSVRRGWQALKMIATRSATDFALYFKHRAFLPSFAGAMLYFTVLSFAGQMVTYLLSAGYDSIQIGIARTLSVVFEVLATWFAPWLMDRIGVVRAGLWLSTCQVITLASGFAVFSIFEDKSLLSASGLVVGTILSRLGLRGFDLCIQLIVQEDVEAESRGAFSSVEAAWQNGFELLAYASTILFYRPDQFKWPSLLSVAAVTSAAAAYTIYVYLRRGHLLHLQSLTTLLRSKEAKQDEHDRGLRRIVSSSDV